MTGNISDKDSMTTTSYSEIERLLESRKNNRLFNTSYPLFPEDWKKYNTNGELPFDVHKPLAFYMHIPFCQHICSFCEYTRICLPDEDMQRLYVKALLSDIENFITKYPNITLYGLDIGGGTPTALCHSAFEMLMDEYCSIKYRLQTTLDFEPSIEATFSTLTHEKIISIARAGISRISLGIQSSVKSVMKPLHRMNSEVVEMNKTLEEIHAVGIKKVNLDLMYGLPCQTKETIKEDLATISVLSPEQVTVYEFRTNQVSNDFSTNAEECYSQYGYLYDGLKQLGYIGNFGQNTFSKRYDDMGVSSYLRHRMLDGWQYKGFGISAQSMSRNGLSYNKGKNADGILRLIDNADSFESLDHYDLPPMEILAKFIAISGYSSGFSISAANEILGDNFCAVYSDILSYLSASELIAIDGDRIQFTRKGFRNYGAILSLFYPKKWI